MGAEGICITGIGLVTPAGQDLVSTWRTLCAGRSLAATDPALTGLPVDFSCRVKELQVEQEVGPQRARRTDRFTHLALAAARRAVLDAELEAHRWNGERVGIILGVGSNSLETYPTEFRRLTDGKPTAVSPWAVTRSVPSTVAADLAIELGAHGPVFTVSTACASGATALGLARDLLRAGTCDIVLAGGSESGRAQMTATCFAQIRALSRRRDRPHLACRPFDLDRDGFVLGEGAAILVLERATHARRRSKAPRALLRGFATTSDAYSHAAPHPDGMGAERALRAALADAGCGLRDVDHINAHAASTPLGDAAEAAMLRRLFDGTTPPVTATKSVIGHALGASAAIEAAVTVQALQHQAVPPTANLETQDPGVELDVVTTELRRVPMNVAVSTSFGFGGSNAVLVLSTP
ncbi:beta-ketoacyl-[acyl-carrier-protein] synthase family protein [Streptomyces sp. HD]|uniref:beta-ketoacyl-[acyl-carrier-protein] synthase family protein n=1 Tax=Streptomyces sp. HD TaxID=3020892 RepID=UPI00232C8E4C|nr:beta-ketoacyl-[acyl-carrier-protein] synthase family protein [Streptomyces sp. HD]MDC0770734.1 beta-ketoacyl-[acyl-carrier-protein] synthase family protein [Streptomyces sp. HD]